MPFDFTAFYHTRPPGAILKMFPRLGETHQTENIIFSLDLEKTSRSGEYLRIRVLCLAVVSLTFLCVFCKDSCIHRLNVI